MPLVPELQAFLAQIPPAPSERPSIEQIRALAVANSAQLPRRPTSIAGTREIMVPGPASELPARVYTPLGVGPFPLVVYFHGGGFVAYTLDTHDQVCRELCTGTGAVVVSVEYRLAPEFRFPHPTDDAYAAVKWLGEHAAELGADAGRMAVAGDSAGANLSLAAALQVQGGGGPELAALLLIYPVADMSGQTEYPSRSENGQGYFLTSEAMQLFGAMYLNTPEDALHPHVSPLHSAPLAGLPPTLVLTAEYDPLRDEGNALAEKLQDQGVDTTYRPGPGLIHGFANMTGFVPAAAQIMDDAAAWLKQKLS
ncbi:alpha/beta hydrolase [Deinococcus sp.]|uniref:alpha/beta hydrolase n=1 Tax=Deinococcus sp. TaxID=47478 RepID=UPI00286E3D69|nr:alpha/beta hydrolase [Deinococcus sp.]